MRRSRYVAVLAGALLALPAAAAAKTKVVYPGGPAKWAKSLGAASVNSFLIDRVTVNAGDTVEWKGLDRSFHTVDIPKLRGSDLPLLTATGKTVNAVMDAAGNPFWFDGKLPELGFNVKLFGPSGPKVYDGTTRIESGLPVGPGPHNLSVQFSTPGVYKYFCDLHHGMVGYVVVKPKGNRVPSGAQDAATLRSEERTYAAEAQTAEHTRPPKNTVSLGASGPGGLEVYAMFPARLQVNKGATVRFFMSKDTYDQHSATFGPNAYLKPLANSFNGLVPSPAAIYASGPPGHIVVTKTSHGNGFASTGVLDRDPDTSVAASNTIRFTQPGTYHFICIIHTFMHGTIVVK